MLGKCWFLMGIVSFALTMLIGCGKKVDVEAFEAPVRELINRHDKYVKDDPKLDATEKRIALRTSELITRLLETALRKEAKGAKKTTCAPGKDCVVTREGQISAMERAVFRAESEQFKQEFGKDLTMEAFLDSLQSEQTGYETQLSDPQERNKRAEIAYLHTNEPPQAWKQGEKEIKLRYDSSQARGHNALYIVPGRRENNANIVELVPLE